MRSPRHIPRFSYDDESGLMLPGRPTAHQQVLLGYGGQSSDPYFANVVSLAHFDDTSGTASPHDDVVRGSNAWTQNAANAPLSTSIYKYGNASVNCGTVGLSNPDSSDWDFGSGDFTIEFWAYWSLLNSAAGGGYTTLSFKGTTGGFGPWIILNIGSSIYFRMSNDGSSWGYNVNGGSLSTDIWYHVAITRSGTSCRGFLDGTQIGATGTLSGALVANSAATYIGAYGASGNVSLTGFVDEFRATKGVARYTSNFTPPTSAFPDF
jgi:hypothetical protein